MKPTVSVRSTVLSLLSSSFRVVVSRVAKSLSSANTSESHKVFRSVDLPALV